MKVNNLTAFYKQWQLHVLVLYNQWQLHVFVLYKQWQVHVFVLNKQWQLRVFVLYKQWQLHVFVLYKQWQLRLFSLLLLVPILVYIFWRYINQVWTQSCFNCIWDKKADTTVLRSTPNLIVSLLIVIITEYWRLAIQRKKENHCDFIYSCTL